MYRCMPTISKHMPERNLSLFGTNMQFCPWREWLLILVGISQSHAHWALFLSPTCPIPLPLYLYFISFMVLCYHVFVSQFHFTVPHGFSLCPLCATTSWPFTCLPQCIPPPLQPHIYTLLYSSYMSIRLPIYYYWYLLHYSFIPFHRHMHHRFDWMEKQRHWHYEIQLSVLQAGSGFCCNQRSTHSP